MATPGWRPGWSTASDVARADASNTPLRRVAAVWVVSDVIVTWLVALLSTSEAALQSKVIVVDHPFPIPHSPTTV